MLSISFNGKQLQVADNTPLQAVLKQYDYHEKKCAVAINGEFIPRTEYSNTALKENDEIDVVVPVGGG